jgi:hypothetical protein
MQLTSTETIQLWYHYEQIAMHFNELIIQYRLQLMGGAGAIGALSTYFIGSHVRPARRRHMIRSWISTIILILFSSAAILDIFYYDKLLQGAIDVLLQFELKHPEINMSTHIESTFSDRGLWVIYTVYGSIIGLLTIFTIWSWAIFLCERRKK